MKPRDQALVAILALRFPSDWTPVFHEHRPYERTVFRWPPGAGPGQNVLASGMVTLTALGSSPGTVVLSGGGCSVDVEHEHAQAGLNHVITWINRSTP